jgi:hypothetical protein
MLLCEYVYAVLGIACAVMRIRIMLFCEYVCCSVNTYVVLSIRMLLWELRMLYMRITYAVL